MTTLPAMSDEQIDNILGGCAELPPGCALVDLGGNELPDFDATMRAIARSIIAARDAQWQAAVDAAVMQERTMCATTCAQRAQLQAIRASAEGNDYATERASEANGCAAAIRARTKV